MNADEKQNNESVEDVNNATHTVSEVGKVKQKSISEKDLEDAAPSGESDIDPA